MLKHLNPNAFRMRQHVAPYKETTGAHIMKCLMLIGLPQRNLSLLLTLERDSSTIVLLMEISTKLYGELMSITTTQEYARQLFMQVKSLF